ncbi:Cilia- and flagella-associated protein 20 [Merluccius polli]|uniref:Cilia- and flagella-associated protein 20 n=1 Tax=Merluccius polli TaxID=89951 RepID=A0AA47MIA4_MERPO|nr:Cilia- and flagella-associated protein 20 [Merluccius polli]
MHIRKCTVVRTTTHHLVPQVRNGHIKRITDNDIQSLVLEVEGTNVSTTYITCPADPKKTLGIKLPFLVMIIKNLKKYFTFEVQVLDDKNVRRRFRASNYQSTTRVKPFICTMPMRLDDGWNQIQFNLSDFTRRAYGTNYTETLRVQIHANCRIRRVYFSDRLYSEDELPAEFKLYLPVQNKAKNRDNSLSTDSTNRTETTASAQTVQTEQRQQPQHRRYKQNRDNSLSTDDHSPPVPVELAVPELQQLCHEVHRGVEKPIEEE